MLRMPKSKYERIRSGTLLKYKSFKDIEAKVIGQKKGFGKYKGLMGALHVEIPNGIKLDIGSGFSDEERKNPPALGSVITIKYQDLSINGVPRFPAYLRERKDMVLIFYKIFDDM
jgi:DNA ligase-1